MCLSTLYVNMIEKVPTFSMREKCYLDKHEDGSDSVKAASIGSSGVSLIPSLAPSSVSSLISSLSPSKTLDKENRQLRLQRTNTNDFNAMRMANLVRERNIDSQAYYKRVSFLPLKIRQVTFLNEDLGGYSGNRTMMGMPGRGKTGVHLNTDQWKKDIDRQVHSWMKTKPVHDNQRTSPRPVLSPTFDGSRKRRQKRHRLRDAEENMETTESVTGGSESLVSVSTDYTKQSSTDTKNSQTTMVSKSNLSPTKDKNFGRSSEDLLETSERHGKQNAYNEIEYQKRYRRIFDLKKHLHFVNSTCLSGQNILKKNQRLPPMNGSTKEEMDLIAPDLLAITSVQKHNEPESVVRYPAPSLVTTTQLTTHISPTKNLEENQQSNDTVNKSVSANTPETAQWQHTNRKPELNVYDKLPRITGKGQKRPGAEQQLTMSDYRVLRETEIRNRRNKKHGSNFHHERKHSVIEEADSACNTHRTNDDRETSLLPERPGSPELGTGRNTNGRVYQAQEEEDGDEDDEALDQYEQTPGMKIRIHIKYKRDLDDAAEGSTDAEDVMNTTSPHHRAEGRIPVKHRTQNKKKSVRQVSE